MCDLAYARHTRARYWALHIITNMWITLLCLPDFLFIVSDPVNALRESRVDHWPTSLVFSIHVYHMLFFRGLHLIDWVHHLLMVVLGAPVMITAMQGPLVNFNHFFMCAHGLADGHHHHRDATCFSCRVSAGAACPEASTTPCSSR